MACPASSKAMDASMQKMPVDTQHELNTMFHQAKWNCFFNAFPITESIDKLFFLFGSGTEKNLGWNKNSLYLINSIQNIQQIQYTELVCLFLGFQFSTLNWFSIFWDFNSVDWIGWFFL